MPTQKINVCDIALSLCETHHIYKNVPLYTERYKKVLSFHKTSILQGIAPVVVDMGGKERAFFIDLQGRRLFNKSFDKAFGFYEDLAAVNDENGFYHINESGKAAYSSRFEWCGNFINGACAVRDTKGLYFHINARGEALYPHRFSYVGDFVYNIAVAVLENGKATHIYKDGTLLHNKLFQSLEPYHKGVAVASDELGYFHIDKLGRALYTERFAKLEPFYNGRAFATTLCGQSGVVSEENYSFSSLESMRDFGLDFTPDSVLDSALDSKKAEQSTESSVINPMYQRYFSNLAFSFMGLQILRTALELNILESLDCHDFASIKSCNDNILESLRDKGGISLHSYGENLLLQWLIQNGFIQKASHKDSHASCLCLTQKGREILKMKEIFLYWLDLPYLVAHRLPQSVRENKEMFSSFFHKGYFELLHTDSKQQGLFSAMAHFYASDYSDFTPQLENEVVCDIGCGSGALLDYLAKKYPHIRPIYADKTDLRLNKSGTFVEMDFFKPFTLCADVFIMSRILHDYDDYKAIKILNNIAHAMGQESRLYIIESVQDSCGQDSEVGLHLLNFLGGAERDLQSYENLALQCGLKIVGVTKLKGIMSAIEMQKEK